MGVLAQLEPKEVFSYFETICGIPHGSGNTGPIADYLVQFAKDNGLEWYRDAANNVVLTKPASPGYEGADSESVISEFDWNRGAHTAVTRDDIEYFADNIDLAAIDAIAEAGQK